MRGRMRQRMAYFGMQARARVLERSRHRQRNAGLHMHFARLLPTIQSRPGIGMLSIFMIVVHVVT